MKKLFFLLFALVSPKVVYRKILVEQHLQLLKNLWSKTMNAYWETGSKFENYAWRPVGSVDIGVCKTLCNDRLRFSFTSIHLGRQRKAELRAEDYFSTYHNDTKVTSLSFSVTWYFSRGKNPNRRIDATSIQNYEKIEEKK